MCTPVVSFYPPKPMPKSPVQLNTLHDSEREKTLKISLQHLDTVENCIFICLYEKYNTVAPRYLPMPMLNFPIFPETFRRFRTRENA